MTMMLNLKVRRIQHLIFVHLITEGEKISHEMIVKKKDPEMTVEKEKSS